MQKHTIYVHSFTVIKFTGVRILSPGNGGIPYPTTKHSFIGIFRKTPFRKARLVQRYNLWISLISMNIDEF
jgi:hypothetical protein